MYVSIYQELCILRSGQEEMEMKSRWGTFQRVENATFYHACGHPAGISGSQIITPQMGDSMRHYLPADGNADLSTVGELLYQNVTVINTRKHADFILCLEDSQCWISSDTNLWQHVHNQSGEAGERCFKGTIQTPSEPTMPPSICQH
jgi:hypothetical protein